MSKEGGVFSGTHIRFAGYPYSHYYEAVAAQHKMQLVCFDPITEFGLSHGEALGEMIGEKLLSSLVIGRVRERFTGPYGLFDSTRKLLEIPVVSKMAQLAESDILIKLRQMGNAPRAEILFGKSNLLGSQGWETWVCSTDFELQNAVLQQMHDEERSPVPVGSRLKYMITNFGSLLSFIRSDSLRCNNITAVTAMFDRVTHDPYGIKIEGLFGKSKTREPQHRIFHYEVNG